MHNILAYVPNKTLYVRESDVILFEKAQEQLGESVSSLFAEFLRDRVERMKPEESRILQLEQSLKDRIDSLNREAGLPQFVSAEYQESLAHAQKARESLAGGNVKRTKVHFWAANAYRDKAERDLREVRQIMAKLSDLLNSSPT